MGGMGGGCAIWLLFVACGGSLRTHIGDEPDSFVRVYVDDCLQHLRHPCPGVYSIIRYVQDW